MRVIAHRGCRDQYPENTLTALKRSAPAVDAVEIDVRRCGSGELVVIHDETLDRVSEVSGRVDETSLGRLQQISVHGSGDRVPSLEDAFAAVPDEVTVNVELKERDTATDAARVASEYRNEVIVSSFDPDILQSARSAGFEDLAYLFWGDEDGPLETAISIDCEYVHPNLTMCEDPAFVERAQDRGLQVNTWTVRTREDVSVARTAGVDGVISDRFDLFDRSDSNQTKI